MELNRLLDLQGLHLDLGLRSSSVQLEPEASKARSGQLDRETEVPEGERGDGFAGTMKCAEP